MSQIHASELADWTTCYARRQSGLKVMEEQELRIGDWTLHGQLNELTGPTGTVRLEPRTCAVLIALAQHAGEVRTREELLSAVWGDAFVGEAVLTHAIWELRRAFGDDAKQPLYIKTVPRRGYRLVAPTHQEATGKPVLRTFLVSQLIDQQALTDALDEDATERLSRRLAKLADELTKTHGGRKIDTREDSFLLLFERPIQAVLFARAWHGGLAALSTEAGVRVVARVAVHLGEVELPTSVAADLPADERPLQVGGVASRVMALAQGGQTLLTRGAFDLARRAHEGTDADHRGEHWLAHGSYLIPEVEGSVEIFEVGVEGVSPLTPPPDSADARRMLSDGIIVGWRPAPGLAVPGRPNWLLELKAGEGGFGEIWLTRHAKTDEPRVFKFCYEIEHLRALQREVTLFRVLKETLGERRDIARILDWNFEEAPYFLEMEYSSEGSLAEWAENHEPVPLTTRLELVAQAGEALAAAHSVGILHKDVKPANILVRDEGGEPRACLTDFGIGRLTEPGRLAEVGVTALGMSQTQFEGSSTSGTRLYMAPEVLAGKPASIQADIYALGVVLYQMVIGDLHRVLAPGWRREVDDELLVEDIAACVDGSPGQRLVDASELAFRLRGLEARRDKRQAERRRREQSQADRLALTRARQRRKLLTAMALASTLVLAVVSIFALQTARARRAADASRDRADGLVGFMLGDLRTTLGTVGRLDAMAGTAQRVLDYYASFDEAEMTDEALGRRVTALHQIGEVHLELGELAAAKWVLEEAARLARSLLDRRPDDTTRQASLADSRYWLGYAALQTGDLELAMEAFESHRSVYAMLVTKPTVDSRWRREAAYGHSNVGLILERQGKPKEALELYRQCLVILEELVQEDPSDPSLRQELATSHQQMGAIQEDLGQLVGALKSYRSHLEILRQLHEKSPDNANLRLRYTDAQAYVAWTLFRQGDMEGAFEHCRSEIDNLTQLVTLDPENTRWQRRLATARGRLGVVLRWHGQAKEAEETISSAREILAKLVLDEPQQTLWQSDLARQHQSLAELLYELGRTAEARDQIGKTLTILEPLAAEYPGDRVAASLLGESYLLRAALAPDEADKHQAGRSAIRTLEPLAHGSSDPEILDPWARSLLAQGRAKEAGPVIEQLIGQGYREPGFVAVCARYGLFPPADNEAP